jgi:hypothetical protein
MKDGTVWGIHGGKTGDADNLFLKKSCVAIARPVSHLLQSAQLIRRLIPGTPD